jgi:RecJ-like exonuclease
MSCKYCEKDAIYRCNICGKLICGEHAKLRTVCTACTKKTTVNYTIDKVILDKERKKIQEIVKPFLGRGRATYF